MLLICGADGGIGETGGNGGSVVWWLGGWV